MRGRAACPPLSPPPRPTGAESVPTRVYVAHRGLFVVAVDVEHLLVCRLGLELLHLLSGLLERSLKRGKAPRRGRGENPQGSAAAPPGSPQPPPGARRTSVISASPARSRTPNACRATPAARPLHRSADRLLANHSATATTAANRQLPGAGRSRAKGQCRGGAGWAGFGVPATCAGARGESEHCLRGWAAEAAGTGPPANLSARWVAPKERDWRGSVRRDSRGVAEVPAGVSVGG